MFKPHYRICCVAFLLDFAVMAGMVATPFFIQDYLKGGPAMLGLFAGVHASTYALTCFVSSWFVSRAKNGLTLAFWGVFVFVSLFSLMPLFRTPARCLGVSTLAVSALAFVWPALHSWVGGERDPKLRARFISLFNISWSFGFALSPLAAGPLYERHYYLPYLMLIVVCVLVMTLIRSLPHESDHFALPSEELIEATAEHNRASAGFLYMAWCVTIVGSGLAQITRSVFTKRLAELVTDGRLRLFAEATPPAILTEAPATKYSWIAFSLCITTAVVFLILGRTQRWHHRFRYAVCSQLAAAGAFWVLARTESLVAMGACFIVVGANLGLAFYSSSYYGLSDAEHKHRNAAINEFAVGAGGVLCLLAGTLVAQFGFVATFSSTPLFVLGAIVLQALLLAYGKARMARGERSATPATG